MGEEYVDVTGSEKGTQKEKKGERMMSLIAAPSFILACPHPHTQEATLLTRLLCMLSGLVSVNTDNGSDPKSEVWF